MFPQGGLVSFDREDVVAATITDDLGGITLAVHGVGSDDRVGDVESAQKRGEHGDFVVPHAPALAGIGHARQHLQQSLGDRPADVHDGCGPGRARLDRAIQDRR